MKTFVGGFGWGVLAATILYGAVATKRDEEQNRVTETMKRKWFRDRTMLRLMAEGRTYEEARTEFLRLCTNVKIIKEKSDD